MMLVTKPRWLPCQYMVKTLLKFLPEPLGHFDKTWYVASRTQAHHNLFKWVDLDLLYGKVKFCKLYLLGWRTLDQRRADARLCLFYKIVHGLVAVLLPEYIQYSNRDSRYCHSMTFRQVSTFTDYYKYSFFP